MFQFYMLNQRPLRPIRLLTPTFHARPFPNDFIRISPLPLLLIFSFRFLPRALLRVQVLKDLELLMQFLFFLFDMIESILEEFVFFAQFEIILVDLFDWVIGGSVRDF